MRASGLRRAAARLAAVGLGLLLLSTVLEARGEGSTRAAAGARQGEAHAAGASGFDTGSAAPDPGEPASPPPLEPIRLVTLDWPPYVGQELPGQGLWPAIVREAFGRSEREVQIVFRPWARGLAEVEAGRFDGIFPEYFAEERLDGFEYSRPVTGGPVGLYARRGEVADASDLAALEHLRLGVVRGYVNVPAIDDDPSWRRDEAASDLLNLRKLAAGRVDLIFIDWLVADQLLRHELPEHRELLSPVEPPLAQHDLHVAFRRGPGLPRAHRAFDEGLAAMARDGSLARLHEQHGLPWSPFDPEEPPRFSEEGEPPPAAVPPP